MGGPILIIENDERLRDVMREWFETVFLDCDIVVAARDGGAVPVVETWLPRAILIDVDALGTESVDTIRQLRAAAPRSEIIALAMDDHEALRRDVRAAGARACVRKADMSDRLVPLLRRVLEPEPGPGTQVEDGWTVVCIEDELEMIKLIEFTLQRGRFRVIGAVSGEQGLDLVRRVRPDVVLLDLMMPDMDGWEVARRLRADRTLRNVPIIVLSVVHPGRYPFRELEVDDYVTKPFVPDELLRRVRKAAHIVA